MFMKRRNGDAGRDSCFPFLNAIGRAGAWIDLDRCSSCYFPFNQEKYNMYMFG
jgi:hypothetical protein